MDECDLPHIPTPAFVTQPEADGFAGRPPGRPDPGQAKFGRSLARNARTPSAKSAPP